MYKRWVGYWHNSIFTFLYISLSLSLSLSFFFSLSSFFSLYLSISLSLSLPASLSLSLSLTLTHTIKLGHTQTSIKYSSQKGSGLCTSRSCKTFFDLNIWVVSFKLCQIQETLTLALIVQAHMHTTRRYTHASKKNWYILCIITEYTKSM